MFKFKIDEQGYFIETVVADKDNDADNLIDVMPPNGLYRARWINGEWVEDMTQEEIDTINNKPKEPTQEERIDQLENMILMMLGGEF
ncbi:hypothetical protein GOQ29_14360 [Clostridium sp. D2Q-14]|uniref:hypothetical protein n=1 Tax=Anaeromonas gelatinilytica TaxID=2683194 RepID=UPI00193AEF06|nr:hypothetical protein [Anaeromonas gelatinilytica]MBS4536800.1 hypothetical protein [Anaeromonas gelatinilytica]